jgi:RNA polymerase sigma-70 factor, ECF subfamily
MTHPANETSDAVPRTADAIWREFSVPIRGFVRRRLPPEVDADDVVQDVFLRVVRRSDQLGDVADLEAWIYRITRSALTDALRSARRRRVRASDVDPASIAAGETDVTADEDERSAMRELLPCLQPFVQRLEQPYRRALELTAIQGVSQQRAASIEGLSLSGMKSRVQRARAQVRREFQRCCRVEVDARGAVFDVRPCTDPACAPASLAQIERLPT